MFSTAVFISAALISTAVAGPWANICASKSANEIRTCDSYGCGQYSAQSLTSPGGGVPHWVKAVFTPNEVYNYFYYEKKKKTRGTYAIYTRGSLKQSPRHHPGVDVLCSDGSVVYAPFTGTIVGQEKPYRSKNAINNGLRLSGRGFCVKIFYIKPIKYKGSIKKGEKLGTLLPLQKVYPGIQSHVHIENCDSSDPTAYL